MPRRRLGVLTTVLCLAAGLSFGVSPASFEARAAATAAVTSADRPNVVLITADDMRADDLEFMPQTRKLLGQAGVTFTDALSNYPLCCPARATLLTGQYSHNHGVKGNEYPSGGYKEFYESGAEEETLPVWLHRAGYRTGFIGKYLNYYGTDNPVQASTGPRYVPPGWDDWNASIGRVFRYYCVLLNQNGTLRRHPGEYQTDLYRRLGGKLIDKYAGSDQPFFLWTSHLAPHAGVTPSADDPCQDSDAGLPTPSAKRHQGMFSGMPLPESPAFNEADMSDKGTYIRDHDKADLDEVLRVHQGRLQALQALDEAVAGTVAALRSRGLLDETVIIFTSDNGWLLGEHRLQKKIFPYDESLGVPLLLRGPGLPAGVRRHQTVGLVDIPATALDLSGAVAKKPQDGTSLLPLARDPDTLARRAMPIEAGPAPGVQGPYTSEQPDWFYQGLRSSSYSYVAWDMNDSVEEEFYNLQQDPFQLESRHATASPELEAVRRAYEVLRDCVGPTCVLELPPTVETGQAPPPQTTDPTGPQITDLAAPSGWIRTDRPTVRYAASDATDPSSRLQDWCSDHALGCDGSGDVTYRLRGEGAHTWRLFVTDSAGNLASRYGNVKVDLYRPRVRAAAPRLKVVEQAGARVAWRTIDSASGVATVDTRLRRAKLSGAFTTWSYPRRLQRLSRPVSRVDVPAGNGTVCVETRAHDVVGRRSAWAGMLCRSRAIDAASLAAEPAWQTLERETWYGGTASVTDLGGASLEVPSTGGIGLVRVVARTGPGMGRLRVDVGGTVLAGLDLDRPTKGRRQFLLPSPGLSGPVTVTVTSAGRPVWLDSVGVVRRPGR